MDTSDLIVVRTFASRVEAELAKGALEAAGIDSMISADDVGGMRPHLSLTNGVGLLVRVEDAEQATEVLGPQST